MSKALRLFAVLLAMSLGAGIAVLQLAPTAELLSQSQRSGGVDYYVAVNFSYAPARTLNFLSPVIFGTPADGSYITDGAFFEDAVYIGLLPLISAFVAVIAWARRRTSALPVLQTVPFWLLIVIVAFVFALGFHTPIFPFLYHNVPTFALFQAPVRWHLWTVFGLSILAGMGVSAWGRGRVTKQWARRTVIGMISMIVVLIIFQSGSMGSIETFAVVIRALMGIAVLGLLAAILTLTQPTGESPRYGRWMIAVLVVIAFDLAVASWGLNPMTPFPSNVEYDSQISEEDRAYWFGNIEDYLPHFFHFDDYRVGSFIQTVNSDLPNTNLYRQTRLFNNFDPLLVAHFAHTRQLIEDHDAYGFGFLVDEAHVYYIRNSNGWQPVGPSGNIRWRAWLAYSVCWHETQEALESALLDPHVPRIGERIAELQMLGDGGCVSYEDQVHRGSEINIALVEEGEFPVRVFVGNPVSAWLVLADTDYPGWKAYVDDVPVPIYRANLMFRAVQLDAGMHNVVFNYEPAWLIPALLITVVSLVVLLFLFRLAD